MKRDKVNEDQTLSRDDDRQSVTFGYQRVRAAEKAGLVRQHFDSIAGKYDWMNTVLSLGTQMRWKRSAVKMLDVGPGESVLDVCGGTADLSLMAARSAGKGAQIVVYDINRAMMEEGRRKAARSPYESEVWFIQGDAESISFCNDSFDRVIVGFGVRNLTYVQDGLQEMFRVLKPGGVFVCLEFARPPSAWFRLLYDLYSFTVMPLVGRIFTGSWRPFTYLPESIRVFPGPARFAVMLERAGFREITRKSHTLGIAVVYRAVKPGPHEQGS